VGTSASCGASTAGASASAVGFNLIGQSALAILIERTGALVTQFLNGFFQALNLGCHNGRQRNKRGNLSLQTAHVFPHCIKYLANPTNTRDDGQYAKGVVNVHGG
jgi:hypothetical protein